MPKKGLCHQAEIAKDFQCLNYRRCFLQCDWWRLVGSGDGTIEDRHPLTRRGTRRLGMRVARDQTGSQLVEFTQPNYSYHYKQCNVYPLELVLLCLYSYIEQINKETQVVGVSAQPKCLNYQP